MLLAEFIDRVVREDVFDVVVKKPTNADRIRTMRDADLAWMFMEFRVDAYATAKGNEGCLPNTHNGILIWLQQPAEGE